MRFEDWLDAERGRLTRVAEHFGVSPSAVSQWRVNGVPVDNILPLHEFTRKEVSLEDLVARPLIKDVEKVKQQAAADTRSGKRQVAYTGPERRQQGAQAMRRKQWA